MTSARKIRANRANARASSGPKTAAGKAQSAQNARLGDVDAGHADAQLRGDFRGRPALTHALPARLPGARARLSQAVNPGVATVDDPRQTVARFEHAAQQVDLSWDLIAAIIGIPLKEAHMRHSALHARPEPH